ncbi:MAG: hypothetical protein NTY77_04855 [Elusimicrobia bacterium]|nr:hypothetical protein [Elusimicrobiota bacterium]
MRRLLTPLGLILLAIAGTTIWLGRQQSRPVLSASERQTLRDAPREVNDYDLKAILKSDAAAVPEVRGKAVAGAADVAVGESSVGQVPGVGASAPGTDVAGFIIQTLRSAGYILDPVTADLNPALKEQEITIWTYGRSGPPPLGFWHVWVFPKEILASRNMPMPMSPDIPLGEAPDELRVIAGHVVAITRSYETLFYDLEKPTKVEIRDDKPQNHPFAHVGRVGKASFSIYDAALLRSAMDFGRFPGKADQGIERNLALVMKNREAGEKYTITGGMDSGTLMIHFGADRLSGMFWPKIDQELSRQ